MNGTHDAKYSTLSSSKKSSRCECVFKADVPLCVCQMAYVTEIKLSGGRVPWSGVAPSSCPEVDLEVIEEYLQEHSLDIQPAHGPASPLTPMGPHGHSHQSTRIIGECEEDDGGSSARVWRRVSLQSE